MASVSVGVPPEEGDRRPAQNEPELQVAGAPGTPPTTRASMRQESSAVTASTVARRFGASRRPSSRWRSRASHRRRRGRDGRRRELVRVVRGIDLHHTSCDFVEVEQVVIRVCQRLLEGELDHFHAVDVEREHVARSIRIAGEPVVDVPAGGARQVGRGPTPARSPEEGGAEAEDEGSKKKRGRA